MKKKMVYVVAAVIVAVVAVFNVKTVLEANRAYDLTASSIDALSEDGDGESDGESNNGEDVKIKDKYMKNHVNDFQACEIKEVYECKISLTIPSWVPVIGGTQCEYNYEDEVTFPGTQNECIYTGNPDNACDYYRCRKNK